MCVSEELRRTAYSLVMYVFMRTPRCKLESTCRFHQREQILRCPLDFRTRGVCSAFSDYGHGLCRPFSMSLSSMAFCLPLWFLIHSDVNSLLYCTDANCHVLQSTFFDLTVSNALKS